MFDLSEDDRTVIFIDGPAFHFTCRTLGIEIDYTKLRLLFKEQCNLVRIYFYIPVASNPDEHFPLKRLLDFLEYNQYSVVTKVGREFIDNNTGNKRISGRMVSDIIIDMLTMAPHFDRMIVCSGDPDLVKAYDVVQRMGVSVSTLFTLQQVSDDLRRKSDSFINLEECMHYFRKENVYNREEEVVD